MSRYDAQSLFISSSSEGEDDRHNNMNDFNNRSNDARITNAPYIGQVFSSVFEAENYYSKFAHEHGFEIKIETSRKHAGTNNLSNRLFVCKRAGRPSANKSKMEDSDQYYVRRRKRDTIELTMCKARMFVVHNVKEDNWKVSSVELAHNHNLVTPSKIDLIETYKNISPATRELIRTLNESGIRPSKMMNVLSQMSGGRSNVNLSDKDIRNVVRNLRYDSLDSNDAQEALDLLRKLERESPGKFFFSILPDENNNIAGIVWVDSRSLMAYKNFGDVVTFDTTYRTNMYNMPFVPFTGVNHHYQSVLFGFALIKNETEGTFEWVLETWLQAMENKMPSTIITDQDKAMNNAIASVMPSVKHLLCTWHISSKYPERLHHLYVMYETFKQDFDKCVYSITSFEFEERWEKLMVDYDLRGHEWLQSLYDIKEKWVGAYTKSYFAAGMTTTGRSESMNSFFDEYVNSTTGFKDFVINSQKAIEKQYLNERKADYDTSQRARNLRTGMLLEKHGAKLYTKKIFSMFSIDLFHSQKYTCKKIAEFSRDGIKGYCVYNEEIPIDRRNYYVVTRHMNHHVTCGCQHFEHSGMLCRHILRYLCFKSINVIPDSLIHSRWMRDANKISGEPIYVSPNLGANLGQEQTMRYNHLCRVYQTLAAKGSTSQAAYVYALESAMREKLVIDEIDPDEVVGGDDGEEENEDEVFPPNVSQTKGRKKNSGRMKSGIEKAQAQGVKKLRKCAECNALTDHDKRNHFRVMAERAKKEEAEKIQMEREEMEEI